MPHTKDKPNGRFRQNLEASRLQRGGTVASEMPLDEGGKLESHEVQLSPTAVTRAADVGHTSEFFPTFGPVENDVETDIKSSKGIIYWHRELPPVDAEPMGEHIVEATSARVPDTLAHRDELWERCYEDLMAQARTRLEQEVVRLGGTYAHVLNESLDTHRDDALGERWLHGCFTYMLYRHPSGK